MQSFLFFASVANMELRRSVAWRRANSHLVMNGNSCVTNYSTMEVQFDNAMEELIAEEELQIYESPEDESQPGAQAANDSFLEEDSQEDIQGRQGAEASLVDTNDLGSLRLFLSQIINLKHGPEAGNQLLLLIETIPKVNSVLGRTNATTRIIKMLKEDNVLPEGFPQTMNKWRIKDGHEATYKARIKELGNDVERIKKLKMEIKYPFDEKLLQLGNTGPQVLSENAVINRIAQMAFLLVAPEATDCWEQTMMKPNSNDRPAIIEQIDGPNHVRDVALEKLVSIANNLKNDWDNNDLFKEANVGSEAEQALAHIRPSQGLIASGAELQSLKTFWVNKHDELLQHLDASGKSLPEGNLERRLECFDNFIGAKGRSKNLGLFICFLVWEGKDYKWTSNRIHKSGSGSGGKTGAGSSGKLSKKEQELKELEDRATVLTKVLFPSKGDPEPTQDGGSLDSSKRKFYDQKTLTEKTSRLSAAAKDETMFRLLSDEQRQQVVDKWFAAATTD